jgi:hypothetical protein
MGSFRHFGGSGEERSRLAAGKFALGATQVVSLPSLAEKVPSQIAIFTNRLDAGRRTGSASEADFHFSSLSPSGIRQGISTQGQVIFTWISVSFDANEPVRLQGQVSNRDSRSAYRHPLVQEFV